MTPASLVYSVVGDRYTSILTGAQTAGACYMFEAWVPPGNGPPPHVHSREDEAFYVVEGEFEFMVAGERVRLSAGDYLVGRRGITHNFRNIGPEPGRMIVTATPAGLEDLFAEVGTLLESREDVPVAPSDADIARLIEAAPKYGLEIMPPSDAPPPRSLPCAAASP